MEATKITTIPTPDDFRRLRSPEQFASRLLYILDKQKRKRRLIFNQAQRDYLNNRTRRDLILKSRQLGFSTFIQAEWFRIVTTRAAGTMTLTHDDDTTQRLRRMADFFYENLPEDFRPKRKYANASVTTYPEIHSEAAIGTAGNVKVGRGFTLTHLHGSEVAFWPDAESILAGAMQAGEPAIALESTPNGAQGYFYEKCMEAIDGNSDWRLHFYPWWWDVTYQVQLLKGEELDLTADEAELSAKHGLILPQIKWRRQKQRELKHLFKQEYPEDPITCFLLSGEGYFGDISHVKRVAPNSLQPSALHQYYAGLDFAQTVDWLALSIIDKTNGCEVELLRLQRLSWQELRRRVIERLMYWKVDQLLVEANAMGSAIESLRSEMLEAGCKTKLSTFKTTNSSKSGLMSNLHEAMHSQDLAILDDPIRIKELRMFQATQTKSGLWQLSAPDGEHDDTVIALGLAWKMANGRKPPEQEEFLG